MDLPQHGVALREVALRACPDGAQHALTDALPERGDVVRRVVQLPRQLLQGALPERVRHQPLPTQPANTYTNINITACKYKHINVTACKYNHTSITIKPQYSFCKTISISHPAYKYQHSDKNLA